MASFGKATMRTTDALSSSSERGDPISNGAISNIAAFIILLSVGIAVLGVIAFFIATDTFGAQIDVAFKSLPGALRTVIVILALAVFALLILFGLVGAAWGALIPVIVQIRENTRRIPPINFFGTYDATDKAKKEDVALTPLVLKVQTWECATTIGRIFSEKENLSLERTLILKCSLSDKKIRINETTIIKNITINLKSLVRLPSLDPARGILGDMVWVFGDVRVDLTVPPENLAEMIENRRDLRSIRLSISSRYDNKIEWNEEDKCVDWSCESHYGELEVRGLNYWLTSQGDDEAESALAAE